MPRLTVFARIAIVAGCGFILLHLFLLERTPSRTADGAIIVLGLLTMAGYALIRSRRTAMTRLIVRTAFVWTGLACFAGLLFLLAGIATAPGSAPDARTVWAAAVVIGFYGFMRARRPAVRRRTIEGVFPEPVRVLQLTDLHIGDVWSPRHLERVINRALRQSPDVVVITGDLLDGMEPVDAAAVAPLGRIDVPVFFVSGNHDCYTRREDLLGVLRRIGVTPLEGSIHRDDRISILGLAYGMAVEPASELLERFSSSPGPRIILKHRPDRLEELVSSAPHAVLCGHVHGGQIWPLGYLARLEFRHTNGTRFFGRTMVHVSQGTATWGPPFRLGTRSEITVLDFVPR